ncbi:MAG: magnesium transporter [bacterium]|nr:magnesium transporter [bacterium]
MQKDILEVAHDISFHPKERMDLFKQVSPQDRGQVILHLSPRIQGDIVSKLGHKELVELLELLDPDEATSVIRSLSKKKQDLVIRDLTEDIRERVSLLLKFDPDTAGGLMSLDYIQVDEDDSLVEVVKQFKTHEKRTGKLPLIIVMKGSEVLGHIPGHVLGFANSGDKAREYTHDIQTIHSSASHREVINLFRKHPHNRIIVLGDGGNVLGAIYSDDVLRVLHEREARSLYEFAGVSNQEQVFDPAWIKVRFRYRWLIINLATSFLAAFTVGLFDETISKYVLLAVYMPIIAGMGGNAATQTLAVLVRGISLGQIKLSNAWGALRNETVSGSINGLINGVLVGSVILLLGQDFKLALVLAVAMVANLTIAGFFGTLVPLIMQRLGKDPASSATIFITTATDVLGFLVFLGLASVVLL